MEKYAKMLEGNKRFEKSNKDFKELVNGQHPEYVVIACSDSRVVPEYIFGAKLGSIFVIRVAGNVVDDAALASIEYAVEELNVKNVLMLAHTHCGAVTAAYNSESSSSGSKLDWLIERIRKNIDKSKETLDEAILSNARKEAAIIRGDPAISGKAEVSIGMYDIETGKVSIIE
ncbi:MAG: carbonic anhydrase [Candidatus Micrarchaeaceae archaeon]